MMEDGFQIKVLMEVLNSHIKEKKIVAKILKKNNYLN